MSECTKSSDQEMGLPEIHHEQSNTPEGIKSHYKQIRPTQHSAAEHNTLWEDYHFIIRVHKILAIKMF